MGTTPIYGLPYPGILDPPNGPNQVQLLAEAAEGKFVTSDASVANLATSIGTYRKLVGVERLTSNTGAFATETAILEVVGAPIPANTFYVVEFVSYYNVSVAGAKWIYRFKNSAGNTLIKDVVDDQGGLMAGVPLQTRFELSDVTTAAQSRSLYVTVERYSGGGNYVAEAGSRLSIYAECPSSLL